MPLPRATDRSKKGINKQVSANISELAHHGTIHRSMKQIIAIAERTARGAKKKMDVMSKMRKMVKKKKDPKDNDSD